MLYLNILFSMKLSEALLFYSIFFGDLNVFEGIIH